MALAVLLVALLIGLALLAEQPRIERRLAARQEAVRAVEGVLEGIRAGVVPLQGGAVPPGVGGGGGGTPMLLWMEVTPTDRPGLDDVRVTANYNVLGEEGHWEARTLVWAP